jgi:hypothetical protein
MTTTSFESFPQSSDSDFGNFDDDEEGIGYKLLRFLTPALLSQPVPPLNAPPPLSVIIPTNTNQSGEITTMDSSRPSTLDTMPQSTSAGLKPLSGIGPSVGLTRAHSQRKDLAKSNALTMVDSFATYGGAGGPSAGLMSESFTLSSIPGFPMATRGDDVRSIASSVRPGAALTHILKRFRGEQGLMKPQHWMSDEASTECSDCECCLISSRRNPKLRQLNLGRCRSSDIYYLEKEASLSNLWTCLLHRLRA